MSANLMGSVSSLMILEKQFSAITLLQISFLSSHFNIPMMRTSAVRKENRIRLSGSLYASRAQQDLHISWKVSLERLKKI
jgi:hypothetical protein